MSKEDFNPITEIPKISLKDLEDLHFQLTGKVVEQKKNTFFCRLFTCLTHKLPEGDIPVTVHNFMEGNKAIYQPYENQLIASPDAAIYIEGFNGAVEDFYKGFDSLMVAFPVPPPEKGSMEEEYLEWAEKCWEKKTNFEFSTMPEGRFAATYKMPDLNNDEFLLLW